MSGVYQSDLKNGQVDLPLNWAGRNGRPIFQNHFFLLAQLLLLAILGLGGGRVNAQTNVVVDLEVRMQISPDSYVPPGTVAYVDVEIINHGPGTAVGPEATSSWFDYRAPPAGFMIYETLETQPCMFYYRHIDPLPGDPMPLQAQLYPPPLAAGQSVMCRVAIQSFSVIERRYNLSFSVIDGIYFAWRPGVTDSNLTNNQAELELRFSNLPEPLAQPETIPATSPIGMAGFILLLAVSAGVMFWRRR